ncbi:hypothetical protein SCHPADRAFT_994972 [Schizopora paradoxa]|uniref:F-box domain-containing protein n=1 Tax=Schizopora paradoxa TaxID=27342 RepID=A0A0H2RX91_9AGAM|nr:hypothetical protein SCHPADRAFT_994972 [Schizopora paradoxa]
MQISDHPSGMSLAFEADSPTLAWLERFASKRDHDHTAQEHLKFIFPWLWNSSWGETVSLDVEGVKELKDAIGQCERITKSLESFLVCSKDRLCRLKNSLETVVAKTYFSILSDDILAIIFEFASFGEPNGKPDYRTPSYISRVSRRFRTIALRLPRLWRFIDSGSQSLEFVQELASRRANSGPIFEVRMRRSPKLNDLITRWNYIKIKHAQAEDHARFFACVTSSLASRITSLRFEYVLDRDHCAMSSMYDHFPKISLPALQELCIDHEDQVNDPDELYTQFYRNWDLPALKVLKARNIVPILRTEVLARIYECTLSIGRHPADEDTGYEWDLTTVMELLGGLTSVKVLTVDLHGWLITAQPNELPTVNLPTVTTLSTSFVGVEFESAKEFRRAFKTPNKQSWTVEVEDNPAQGPLWTQLDDIFFYASRDVFNFEGTVPEEDFEHELASRLRDVSENESLTDVNLIIHRNFGRSDCGDTSIRKNIPIAVPNLQNLSVTYPDGEQGFFGKGHDGDEDEDDEEEESKCTVQVRKVELKNCKGKVKELLGSLEKKFVHESFNGYSRLVLDGSDIQTSENSRNNDVSASGWSTLVRDAKVIRDDE